MAECAVGRERNYQFLVWQAIVDVSEKKDTEFKIELLFIEKGTDQCSQ